MSVTRHIRALSIAAAACVQVVLPSATFAYELCDNQAKRQALYAETAPMRKALGERRFDELDRKLNGLIDAQASHKLPDQTLDRWFRALFSGTGTSDEPLYRDWISAHPKSAAAYLAAGYAYEARGWAARGNKFAPQTSKAQFMAMRREFRAALSFLDQADEIRETSVSAALRIRIVAGMSSFDSTDLRREYLQALRKFPGSLQLRVVDLEMSAPKWGGSEALQRSVEDDMHDLPAADRRYVHYLLLERLGDNAFGAGDKKKAAELYEKAVPLCPGLEGAIDDAMKVDEQIEDYDALIRNLDRYIARFPYNGWGYAKRAWAYSHKLRWVESFRDDEKSASLGFGRGYFQLAWHYEMGSGVKQDYKRAIELYEIAFAHGEAEGRANADRLRASLGKKAN